MVGLGRGPTTDDEVFSVSVDFKCIRKKGEGLGRGPTNDDEKLSFSTDFKCFMKGGSPLMIKYSLFLLISNVLGKRLRGGRGGPQMLMKNYLFPLISNVL